MRSTFKRVDRRDYPELTSYSWDDIYGNGDNMAPGGLYLAARMARSLSLQPGRLVLDIGCGKGDSSIFLARHFGVRVTAVDLWISSRVRSEKFAHRGVGEAIRALQLDVRRKLPFEEHRFDAMFCMQTFHSFGGTVSFLRHLLRYLKPGGRLSIGGTCFSEELPGGEIPTAYADSAGWDTEYENYHSPGWWRALFLSSQLVDVLECEELEDGVELWEDELLNHGQRAEWSREWFHKSSWLRAHLEYGRNHVPYLTHFVATVEKRAKQ